METITRINGNGQSYTTGLPKLIYLTKYFNEAAINHVFENTRLLFQKAGWWYEAQPENSNQIAALFMTYNFKTRYYNNSSWQNTLMLKGDYHIGFDVESICFECAKRNHISINGLKDGDFLAC
jgi:hypothetical protein